MVEFVNMTKNPSTVKTQRYANTGLYLLLILTLLLGWQMATARSAGAEETFGFPQVVAKARQLAESPFQKTEDQVPKWLAELSFEKWQGIRFKADKTLWRGERLPFEVQLYHLGCYYNRPVRINIIETGNVRPIVFTPDFFEYDQTDLREKLPAELAFAGFRLLYPLNTTKYPDELITFLGASFFRAVGKGQRPGIWARGVAVDTAMPSGEEFPYLKEFWLEKPPAQSLHLVIYGLLDSPSTTGAYKFTVVPAKDTVVNVESTLFQRHRVQKLGLAPLMSMYYYGENSNYHLGDSYRPEVHDTDGLSIHGGSGEWLWRPLATSERLQVNAFSVVNPQGFGLMQRDLNFDHYQDLEARYDLRPSTWITPKGQWGEGYVELIQIPTPSENHNNITAYWVPKNLPEPGHPMELSYSLRWQLGDHRSASAGRVVATRSGKGKDDIERKFIVDFLGGPLESVPADAELEGMVTVGEGAKLMEQKVVPNPITGGWRLVFTVRPEGENPFSRALQGKKAIVELRAFLKWGPVALTETWSYGVLL